MRYAKLSTAIAAGLFLALASGIASGAGDRDAVNNGFAATAEPMPTIVPGMGMYGTDTDNEDNNGSGNPDKDMGTNKTTSCVFNDSSVAPIEFNIFITDTDPSYRAATLQMAVWDVDTNTQSGNPEIDYVYINGQKIGTLNGANSEWFYNVFDIPSGTLKQGMNTIKVTIDEGNPGKGYWCTSIDWGVITLTGGGGGTTGLQISKGWVTPTQAKSGSWINIFAEVAGTNVSEVKAYYDLGQWGGLFPLATLTDPDGDHTYSGQFQLPAGLAPGQYYDFRIIATDSGNNKAYWPGIYIQ